MGHVPFWQPPNFVFLLCAYSSVVAMWKIYFLSLDTIIAFECHCYDLFTSDCKQSHCRGSLERNLAQTTFNCICSSNFSYTNYLSTVRVNI